jgi:hypothetical protein
MNFDIDFDKIFVALAVFAGLATVSFLLNIYFLFRGC